jgi:hypothetical protein
MMERNWIIVLLVCSFLATPALAANLEWNCALVSDDRMVFNNEKGTVPVSACTENSKTLYRIGADCSPFGVSVINQGNIRLDIRGLFELQSDNLLYVYYIGINGSEQINRLARNQRSIASASISGVLVSNGQHFRLDGVGGKEPLVKGQIGSQSYQYITCTFVTHIP